MKFLLRMLESCDNRARKRKDIPTALAVRLGMMHHRMNEPNAQALTEVGEELPFEVRAIVTHNRTGDSLIGAHGRDRCVALYLL